MTAVDTKTTSPSEAILILTKDVIVPGQADYSTGLVEDMVGGGVRVSGDLAGRPGHMASAVVRPLEDGTIYPMARAVVPRRWKFATTIMPSMLTQEIIEEFAEHISSHIFAETQAPNVAV